MSSKSTIRFEIDFTYQDFLLVANKGYLIIKEILEKNPNYYAGILCPLRGGFYFSDFLSRKLNLKLFFLSITSYGNTKTQKDFQIDFYPELQAKQRYLICDDIIATGNTIRKILSLYPNVEFETIALFKHKDRKYDFKHYAIREVPSFVWVNFFWETYDKLSF
ncbi:MAG: phosphoribosyltransferase domain-containing protein [Leptospiraceae bacterium]|nr:phosphoribosyltransferase domain-containing protein [Leptospiraceae bacterium]MDW7976840.1 phosphoribosyltransferase family protein [Leptospiraceae bacterium]